MSVTSYSSTEFAYFAARIANLRLMTLEQAADLVASVSHNNAKAYEHQYGEFTPALSADAILSEARGVLDDVDNCEVFLHGNFAYNCIANDGTVFDEGLNLDYLREIQAKVDDWLTVQQKEWRRKCEVAKAYNEQPRLPSAPRAEILERCRAMGCTHVITARYQVTTSTYYGDGYYHDTTTLRTVAIGFANMKRTSFKQFRQAAAKFAPTAKHYAPGCDLYQVDYRFTEFVSKGVFQQAYFEGQISPWHSQHSRKFTTKSEAEAYLVTLEPIKMNGQGGSTTLTPSIVVRSVEKDHHLQSPECDWVVGADSLPEVVEILPSLLG